MGVAHGKLSSQRYIRIIFCLFLFIFVYSYFIFFIFFFLFLTVIMSLMLTPRSAMNCESSLIAPGISIFNIYPICFSQKNMFHIKKNKNVDDLFEKKFLI